MKLKIIAVAMGLSLAFAAARANNILAITETGEKFNDLIVTFNGTPLSSINITGTANNWTIGFPSFFTFLPISVIVAEPEITPLSQYVNRIVLTETSISWFSEQRNPTGQIFPNPVTVRNHGTVFTVSGEVPFNLLLTDNAVEGSVPDGGTTAMLLGTALTGLGFIRRFAPR